MLVAKHGNADHIKQLLDKGMEKADFADGPGSNSHRILTISLQHTATRKPDVLLLFTWWTLNIPEGRM